ncbi:PIN domain-containing protein [Candidatus Woesearchaeota archaeon]|nr:PIN domain-containing protein [Candidatus Woesearchaeota archaeon]
MDQEMKFMTEEFFLLDSNILIYAYNRSEEYKGKIAEEIIEDCIGRDIKGCTSFQCLGEFSKVMISKYHISCKEVKEIIKDLCSLQHFRKIHYDKTTIISALDLSENYNLHFWDALIVATMLENGIYQIYTENTKDFKKIPQISAVNPFEKEFKKQNKT